MHNNKQNNKFMMRCEVCAQIG